MTDVTVLHPYTATYDEDRKKLYGQPGSVWAVWDVISSKADVRTGECWPSVRWIAQVCGLATRVIRSAIQTLESLGLIAVKRRKATSSIYTVRLATQRRFSAAEPTTPTPAREAESEAPTDDLTPCTNVHRGGAQTCTQINNREQITTSPSIPLTGDSGSGGEGEPSATDSEPGWLPPSTAAELSEATVAFFEHQGMNTRGIAERVAEDISGVQVRTSVMDLPARAATGEACIRPDSNWEPFIADLVSRVWGESTPRSIMDRFCSTIAPLIRTGEVSLHMIATAIERPADRRKFFADGSARALAVELSKRRMTWNLKLRAMNERGSTGDRRSLGASPTRPELLHPTYQKEMITCA